MNPLTRTPSWLAAHWRGAAIMACAIGAVAALRWNYDKDPERKARTQEKDLNSLAERISKYARDMQEKYPSGLNSHKVRSDVQLPVAGETAERRPPPPTLRLFTSSLRSTPK